MNNLCCSALARELLFQCCLQLEFLSITPASIKRTLFYYVFFLFSFFYFMFLFFLPVCTLVPTSTIPSRAKHSSENSCLRQMTRQWDSRHEHLTHQINKIVKRHKKALSFSPGPCSVSPCLLGSQRPSVFLRNEGRLVSAPLALTGHLRPPARSLKQQPSWPL